MQSQTGGAKFQEPQMTADGGYSIGCNECVAKGHSFMIVAGTRWGVKEALKTHVQQRHDRAGH